MSSEYDSDSSDMYDNQDSNLQLSGLTLRNYNVITEIGRGAYCIVWLVYNIEDKQFYAMKVQHYEDYEEGLEEMKILKRLPEKCKYFNHLLNHFIHIETENSKRKKYICSLYELCAGNLDGFIRKGDFKNGYPEYFLDKIVYQLFESLRVLHDKVKVFHGDIKPDNILLTGLNEQTEYITKNYKKLYLELENEDREIIHKKITDKLLENIDNYSKYKINENILLEPKIKLCDFGDFCDEDEQFNEEFGTRYYRPPEGILMGDCEYGVDIWAMGCTLYELVTGEILFDPDKDDDISRDFYHLQLIGNYCGKYSKRFLKYTKYWRKFFSKDGKLKKLDIQETDKFNIKFSTIIKSCLEINPSKRLRASQIIKII